MTLTKSLSDVALLSRRTEDAFPGHRNDDRLAAQIAAGEDLWDRRNWNGHLTGSAVVVDLAAGRCLMMQHKALGLELVPGGHCDPFEHPCKTALRELIEETGMSGARLCPWHAEHGFCPIDIDTHPIPANATRGELAHFHHDFRYVFTVEETPVAVLDEAEATWLGWRPLVVLQDRYPRLIPRLPTVIG